MNWEDVLITLYLRIKEFQSNVWVNCQRFTNGGYQLGWINRITDIENAGLVRSTAGLLTHIFGKIAAAMCLKAFPQFRL